MTTKRRRLTKITVTNNDSVRNEEANFNESTVFTTNEGRNNTEMFIERSVSNSSARTMNSEESIPYTTQPDQIGGNDFDLPETSVKRRGPTLLADVWNQPPEEKYVVKFNKE